MLSVNFQPPQIKADAKSESVLPNAGRGSGRAGGKATFLQFLHPKKDPKSGQVAKDAELASGTRSTVKAVLNETKPSRPPVARPKNSPAKAEAKSAGKGSKHAAATKKKSNVAEDRDAPVAALGQAQQQIATQLAAKFSLVAKAKTLNKSENTKVAGQLMPTEATSKNQAGKLVKSIRVTTSGKVNLLETSKVSAAKVSSKAEIQSFAKPIKTVVDGSSNSLEPKERSSGGKSKNFKATGTKNLAQAVTHGKNKSAESTKTVLEPRKQPAPTIVNAGDTRGGRSAKTVQHRVSQERPSGENAPRVSVTQGAAKHQLSDAPKVTSAGKPVTVQDKLKLFSLKEGRDVAQPGRQVPLGKVAQSATKPDQAPVQGSFPDATKKNHSSRQEPQVQKKASEPVATKRQISNAVSPPASLKPKHVAVSKPQAAHPSKIHQPAAKTKIEPLGQARSKGLPTEIGLKLSNGASVSVAVGQEIKKEKAGPMKQFRN